MNNKGNEVQYYVYQTNLKELFLALWKRKRLIISLTLLAAMLVAVYSEFLVTPRYETKLNIIINMPEFYKTRYGEYKLPISDNNQYLDLIKNNDVIIATISDMNYDAEEVSIEGLRERINIVGTKAATGTKQNSFEVIVSANSPEESLDLAQILYSRYLIFLDVMTKEKAINYYYDECILQNKNLENELKNIKQVLKKNEELLNETSKTFLNGSSNIEIQRQLNETNDYLVPINTINPNYISIENDIIQNKQSINEIEILISMNDMILEELNEELQSVKRYYETGKSEELESKIISSITNNVYLLSSPAAPTHKSSPSILFNTSIGVIVGLFIGVLIALVKEYWLDTK